jgi:hypothetical protein
MANKTERTIDFGYCLPRMNVAAGESRNSKIDAFAFAAFAELTPGNSDRSFEAPAPTPVSAWSGAQISFARMGSFPNQSA